MIKTRFAPVSLFLVMSIAAAHGQTAPDGPITLEWCQAAARNNYPAISKLSLIDRSEKLSLTAANTAWLPKITLSGKITGQSDATKIELALPAPLPSPDLPQADTDQYQIAAEIAQTVWDGGLTAARKKAARAASEADRTKVETTLYGLRSRVTAAYFGILTVESQLEQNALLREELAANRRRVEAWVTGGVATSGDLDAVRVEELSAEQTRINLYSARQSLLATLSLLTGSRFTGGERFSLPETAAEPEGIPTTHDWIARPETAWFTALERANDSQKAQLLAQAMPRLSAFAQAGYGKPGLNALDDDPSAFWIAGVRFSWSIDGFWSLPFTLAKVDADSASIEADRDAFYRSVETEAAGKRAEIGRLEALIAADARLLELRERMKDAAKTKLESGTIGTVDYLREITAEALARQAKALHETQLLEARFALGDTLNK